MIAYYVFVSLFIAGMCTTVYAGASPSSPSPYSQEAQKSKNEKIIGEYFDSRDNNVGETVGILTGEESAENSQSLRSVARPGDGVTIESTHTPSKNEAIRPVDIHARQAQDTLEKDLKQTGIVENIIKNEPHDIAENDAGNPDTLAELVTREEHKRGENIKPEIKKEDLEAWKYAALGGA